MHSELEATFFMDNTIKLQEIQIQIICQNLPGNQFQDRTSVRLGIQKGTCVIDDVSAEATSATFMASIRVVRHPKTGKLNFLGPYTQGTPQERFIYLCWGERRNEGWDGFRRAKLQLRPLSLEVVEKALTNGQIITVIIDMLDSKGEPLCATIKPDKVTWRIEP